MARRRARLGASFNDSAPLAAAGLPAAIIDEIEHRTPGYRSWQQEVWQVHCGDACAYLGDAPRALIQEIGDAALARLFARRRVPRAAWRRLRATYRPGGSPAIYRFQCRHCGTTVLTVDRS